MWKIAGLIPIIVLGGCAAGARLEHTSRNGGQVRLHGAYMPAVGDARVLMAEHCGGRFVVQEQGDALQFRCAYDAELAHNTRLAP
jgi:hypothetical protein